MNVVLAAFAVYAITLVVSSYGGIGHIFVLLRNKSPDWLRELLECFVCLSFWVAAPFAIILGFNLLEYIAVIGGAIAIYEVTAS